MEMEKDSVLTYKLCSAGNRWTMMTQVLTATVQGINNFPKFLTMKATLILFWIVISWILITNTEANRSHCPISANINEFQSSFETLKDFLHTKDTITDVTLLKAKVLKHIQPFEQCCFLRNLGNFYVDNVFPVLELKSVEQHRDLFHLANSLLSLSKELNKCHAAFRCPCGEQSHAIMKQFKENYFKITPTNAAIKAVGELNILFHWIKKNFLP
ncbi:interleukin-20-like [Phyllobates terribilis]|uniref:interleukin-20-like n=1 Tax=Phyllobates terribilis TaxID=111132 RepID=UPI003CCA8EE0